MFGVLLAEKQRQVTNKVAVAGSKILESEEDEEQADDNDNDDDEEEEAAAANQVSSDTVLANGGAGAATTIAATATTSAVTVGDTTGCDSNGTTTNSVQQCAANISYRKLAVVSPPSPTAAEAAGQFSRSIFEDKTGNSELSKLRNQDFVGDIQKSSDLAGKRHSLGELGLELEARRGEFGACFKDKLDEDYNLRQLADKTSENAQLKRFKSDGVASSQRQHNHHQQQQQQQNDQMRQSFQSSFERSAKLLVVAAAAASGPRANPLADGKQQQQQARRMTATTTTTTTIATDSQKQNDTTGTAMASNNGDYIMNQNGARVQVEPIPSYGMGATSLVELSRATTVTIGANEAVCNDDDDADREDEQTSAQVAAAAAGVTSKDGGRLGADEYGPATGIPDGRYGGQAPDCRLSPASDVTSAIFGGQGQQQQQQQQQERQSAMVGTNQVLVAVEDGLAVVRTKRAAGQAEGGLQFGSGSGSGSDTLRRQPLRRTWQQQKQPLESAPAPRQPPPLTPPPSNTNANPQQSARSSASRLLSIAQHHTTSGGSGDGEQRRAGLGVVAARSRLEPHRLQQQQQQLQRAPGDDGNDRSCASYRNENYENHIHLEHAFGGSSACATSVEDNKEKWYECTATSDATARSAYVNNSKRGEAAATATAAAAAAAARDGDLYRLAMIDQKEKKETMTENQLKQYPPNHPLGNSKHLCAICGDRATGKHYGVFSCEGCKGFFKRTIRKDIVYVCRAQGDCLIDMRQRNRCQYCRYQKCLSCGMKREAVQEEKQRLKLRAAAASAVHQQQQHQHQLQHQQQQQQLSSDINSNVFNNQCDTGELKLDSTNHYNQYNLDYHLGASPPNYTTTATTTTSSSLVGSQYDRFSAAYHSSSGHSLADIGASFRTGPMRIDELTLKWAAQVQIECLLDWAKSVPKFSGLLIDDQVTLLKAYWNELIIAHIAFKTAEAIRDGTLPGGTDKLNSLCIGRGLFIDAYQAYEIGLGNMFDRIIDELVVKMRDMRIDVNELACLRAIILFNPETHGLKTSQPIEEYRGDIYTTLEAYCRRNYENQPNRFGKLLLRLPALRSIGLKCDSMRQQQRRCDSGGNMNHQLVTTSHQGFVTRSSPASRGSSSPTNSSVSSISSTSTTTNTTIATTTSATPTTTTTSATATTTNPNYKYGYQVNLLFFGLCYELSSIDSFLRSSFSLN